MRRCIYTNSANGSVTYAIWDAANVGSAISLSGSPLLTETSSGVGEVRANIAVASGNKRYWEATVGGSSTANMVVGIDNGSGNLNAYTGGSSGTTAYYGGGGYFQNGSFYNTGQSTYSPGDVIGIALDLSAWTVQFYKNGTASGSAISIASGSSYYPANGSGGATMITTANFGQSAFAYSVPTGFTGGVY